MTEQTMEAMLSLYAKEGGTNDIAEKAIIDEALDQLLAHPDADLPAAYLRRNALSNAKKKVYRRTQRSRPLELLEDLPDEQRTYEAAEWRDLLDRLPFTPRQKRVLLRCAQGYSIQEIALECGTTKKAVYALRQRARSMVLTQMDHIA